MATDTSVVNPAAITIGDMMAASIAIVALRARFTLHPRLTKAPDTTRRPGTRHRPPRRRL